MNAYIVCYDLRAPGRNYDTLYEKLRTYSKWAKVTESNWVVVTADTATQIRDSLMQLVDSNDRIFVVKSGRHAAWRNSICKNEWLKENL